MPREKAKSLLSGLHCLDHHLGRERWRGGRHVQVLGAWCSSSACCSPWPSMAQGLRRRLRGSSQMKVSPVLSSCSGLSAALHCPFLVQLLPRLTGLGRSGCACTMFFNLVWELFLTCLITATPNPPKNLHETVIFHQRKRLLFGIANGTS